MTFDVTLEMSDDFAKMTLSGELDSKAASAFKMEVEKTIKQQVKHLVLLMADLDYISSAGLRVLVFAKQKMGTSMKIYIAGVQESVLETIQMVGFHESITILNAEHGTQLERGQFD